MTSAMRAFTTAGKREEKPDELRFMLDDFEVVSLRPSEGQLVMLMAAEASEIKSDTTKIAAYIDFSMELFDKDSRHHIVQRLMARNDTFEFDQLVDIVMWLVEEWSNRPTKPSSDSTSSPDDDGTSSTVTSLDKASTSGSSTQLAPAT